MLFMQWASGYTTQKAQMERRQSCFAALLKIRSYWAKTHTLPTAVVPQTRLERSVLGVERSEFKDDGEFPKGYLEP